MSEPREYKLIFTGPMGAGKTTAIRAVSEIGVVATEAANTDRASCDKDTTTVAMDYGEITLPGGSRLRLYGTPGQVRFEYMWRILAKGAVGAVILIDASRPDPLADFTLYADRFGQALGDTRLVVGIGRHDAGRTSLSEFNAAAQRLGLAVPIVTADVRRTEDVQMLLDILFTQIEVAGLSETALPAGG